MNGFVCIVKGWKAVGIMTRYGFGDQGVGVRVPEESRLFTSLVAKPALGLTQPPTQWVPGGKAAGA
jgi:hypothetical protein